MVELREIEGPAVYVAEVLDRFGAAWQGRVVGRYYPSAPNSWPNGSAPENVPHPAYAAAHVVFGQTQSNGKVEFGIGSGDYAGPGDGVTALWLAEHYAGSDVLEKMGMLPNTNHRTLSPTFRYVPANEEPVEDDPVVVPDDGTVEGRGCLLALAAAIKAFAAKL